jgi:hypothetical protein
MQTQRLDHMLQRLSAVTAARYSAAAVQCADVTITALHAAIVS